MIDDETLERIETLAGLRLSPQQREKMRQDLSRILAYFQKLQEVPTDSVQPFDPLAGQTNAWREDVPRPSLPRDQALANAPATREGHFFVPPVFEE